MNMDRKRIAGWLPKEVLNEQSEIMEMNMVVLLSNVDAWKRNRPMDYSRASLEEEMRHVRTVHELINIQWVDAMENLRNQEVCPWLVEPNPKVWRFCGAS
jgi:hypothetical protein